MQFMFIPLNYIAIYLFFSSNLLYFSEDNSTGLTFVEFDGYIHILHNNIKNIHHFLENNKHNISQRFTG